MNVIVILEYVRVYLDCFCGFLQLGDRVVVRQQVRELALCVHGGHSGQHLLQLADPLLVGLQQQQQDR